MTCIVVALLFIAKLVQLHIGTMVAISFVLAMGLLISSFAAFLIEVRMSLIAIHIRPELLEKEQQIRVLMMEVNHRSKNMLTVVQALARRSAQHDPEFLARFEQRIGSLAANQDLLIRRGWSQIPVAELVEAQLAFLARETRAQINAGGDPFDLSPRAAEIIGMALHELATNALKYGALAVRGGRITLRWSQPAPNRFSIAWTEAEGPEMLPPQRPGFGTTLVRDIPARSLNASVDLRFASEGLNWKLECDSALVQELT